MSEPDHFPIYLYSFAWIIRSQTMFSLVLLFRHLVLDFTRRSFSQTNSAVTQFYAREIGGASNNEDKPWKKSSIENLQFSFCFHPNFFSCQKKILNFNFPPVSAAG